MSDGRGETHGDGPPASRLHRSPQEGGPVDVGYHSRRRGPSRDMAPEGSGLAKESEREGTSHTLFPLNDTVGPPTGDGTPTSRTRRTRGTLARTPRPHSRSKSTRCPHLPSHSSSPPRVPPLLGPVGTPPLSPFYHLSPTSYFFRPHSRPSLVSPTSPDGERGPEGGWEAVGPPHGAHFHWPSLTSRRCVTHPVHIGPRTHVLRGEGGGLRHGTLVYPTLGDW